MNEPRYIRRTDGSINKWFGLSYASYMVLPRTVMMDMPLEWQERFVEMVCKLNDVMEKVGYGGYVANVSIEHDDDLFSVADLENYRHPNHSDPFEMQ